MAYVCRVAEARCGDHMGRMPSSRSRNLPLGVVGVDDKDRFLLRLLPTIVVALRGDRSVALFLRLERRSVLERGTVTLVLQLQDPP